MASYPSAVITWVDRVDNVDYYYAADINASIAEIKAIVGDLVGVGGTAGGLAQGGASFYARWTAQHNTSGTHKAISAPTSTDTINGAVINGGTITATFVGALTGNASTATTLQTARNIGGTSFNGSADITPAQCTNADTVDTYHHDQSLLTSATPTFASLKSGASFLKWKTDSGNGITAAGLYRVTFSGTVLFVCGSYNTAGSTWKADTGGSWVISGSDLNYTFGDQNAFEKTGQVIIFYT
jgi:hypothetical protein